MALGSLGGPRSDTACALTVDTDMSDLHLAPTCAGLGGAQEKPICESRLAAANARPGGT